jgi:hypothetical protein
MVESPNASQMAIDGLRIQPLAQELIRVLRNLALIHRLNRDIHPKHKMLKDVHVVLDRVRGVVASLQEAPVAHDHMAHVHLSASFR